MLTFTEKHEIAINCWLSGGGAQSVVGLVRPPYMSEISEGETTTGGV